MEFEYTLREVAEDLRKVAEELTEEKPEMEKVAVYLDPEKVNAFLKFYVRE